MKSPTTTPAYRILPIEGMGFVQKNFEKYRGGGGNKAVEELVGSGGGGKVSLAKRFQLIERGYYLEQLPAASPNDGTFLNSATVFLQCKALHDDKENAPKPKQQPMNKTTRMEKAPPPPLTARVHKKKQLEVDLHKLTIH